jgi:hypothetical protein
MLIKIYIVTGELGSYRHLLYDTLQQNPNITSTQIAKLPKDISWDSSIPLPFLMTVLPTILFTVILPFISLGKNMFLEIFPHKNLYTLLSLPH